MVVGVWRIGGGNGFEGIGNVTEHAGKHAELQAERRDALAKPRCVKIKIDRFLSSFLNGSGMRENIQVRQHSSKPKKRDRNTSTASKFQPSVLTPRRCLLLDKEGRSKRKC